MHLIVAVIFWIVGLVILYWVIRTGVRDGILAAWRARSRAEKKAHDDKAQGW